MTKKPGISVLILLTKVSVTSLDHETLRSVKQTLENIIDFIRGAKLNSGVNSGKKTVIFTGEGGWSGAGLAFSCRSVR